VIISRRLGLRVTWRRVSSGRQQTQQQERGAYRSRHQASSIRYSQIPKHWLESKAVNQ